MNELLESFASYALGNFATTTIFVIGLLELACILFLSSYDKQYRTSVVRFFKFKRPFYSVSIIIFIGLFLLSFFYSKAYSPYTTTYVLTGITIYIISWLMRYQPHFLDLLGKRVKSLRPIFNRYYHFLNKKFKYHTFHSGFIGLWLTIIALSIISKSLSVFLLAFCLFPLLLGNSIIQSIRKDAANKNDIRMPKFKDLFLESRYTLTIVLVISLSVAILTGILSRQFPIFLGDIETAKSLLLVIAQILGSIGILAITIIFVLTQLTASNYSIRIASLLFRQPVFLTTLLLLVSSIIYNLIVVSNAASLLPSDVTIFNSVIVDIGLLLALLTAASIAYFIFRSPRLLSPEAIIKDSLKTFNKDWLDIVKRDWQHPNRKITLNVINDPFIVIERVLHRAITSGDNLTFVSGLILIRDHLVNPNTIDPQKRPEYLIEVDAYFTHHLRSLIRTAAQNHDSHSLLLLLEFIKEIGQPSPDSIQGNVDYLMDSENAAGELLIRDIIRQSLSNHLVDCVIKGIYIIANGAIAVIKTLPDQTSTWQYNGMPDISNISKGGQDTLWANDRRIETFVYNYISYFAFLGENAANLRAAPIVSNVCLSINEIVVSIVNEIKGNLMKAMLLRRALSALHQINENALKNQLSSYSVLYYLQSATEKLNPGTDESSAWEMARWVSSILKESAKFGLLDLSEIIDSTILTIHLSDKFLAQSELLIKSMGESAITLKKHSSFQQNNEIQFAFEELKSRIKQIGQSCKGNNAKKINKFAQDTLNTIEGA